MGTCQPVNEPVCDDGNACTDDKCSITLDACYSIPLCEERDCQITTCDPAEGICRYSDCPTRSACEEPVCLEDGTCSFADKCEDGIPCTDNYCDIITGECRVSHDDLQCKDEIDCTYDMCTDEGCVSTPVDAECDDNNSCTTDICTPEGCKHRSYGNTKKHNFFST